MYDCEDHWISKMCLVETSLICFAKSWGSCYLTPADRAGSQCLLTQPYSTQSTALCLFGTRKAEQGNYSLRRPPKLIIPPMFNEQSGYSKKLY